MSNLSRHEHWATIMAGEVIKDVIRKHQVNRVNASRWQSSDVELLIIPVAGRNLRVPRP